LLKTTSLVNRKELLINFGTLIVFMVGRVTGAGTSGEGGRHEGKEWVVGCTASEHQRRGMLVERPPFSSSIVGGKNGMGVRTFGKGGEINGRGAKRCRERRAADGQSVG